MTTRIRNPATSEIQIVLRIWTILATAAAMFLMVTSKQSTMVYGIPLQAQYNYATAFKFFVYANGIACGLSVLSLIVALALYRRDTRASHCFFLATLDLVVMSLVMAGFAAAAAVGYIEVVMSLVMAGFAAAAAVGYIEVVMSLVMAGFAAAAAVGYIGKYGEMSICDNVAIFCRRVTTSVAASFIAFPLLKVIAIMSVFRL